MPTITDKQPRILWVDDEIDLLRSHLLFLENKGYEVDSVTNGADAVDRVRDEKFDIVLLDEQMPGRDGLETLEEIKSVDPEIPVVMVTKSEEEGLMEEALGGQISDYLTKPVNPSQILLTCKRLLEREQLRGERVSQDYLSSFRQISQKLMSPLASSEWAELYSELVRYDRELEDEDEGIRQVLEDQFREANAAFGRFVEDVYPEWMEEVRSRSIEHRPELSVDLVPNHVAPHLQDDRPVVLFVIDCLRYDQWLEFEELLRPLFEIDRSHYFSILPTATPYARNAIFSGLLPVEIARRFPEYWGEGEEDEHSRNRYEEELLNDLFERRDIDARVRYQKILTGEQGQSLQESTSDLLQVDLSAVVVNFLDILAHSRSDSQVLKEIAPDEKAFRALTRTWFEHSWLYQTFRELASYDCRVVVTTDHGAVRSLHATEVIGDRETSTSLRYKYGKNLKCDDSHAIFVKDPREYGLPRPGINTNYILAKEDYYFVYPTNYHEYEKRYNDTLQHGGASLEEMILPVVSMQPRER